MFRLLIFFVILIFVGVLSYCIYQILKKSLNPPKTNSTIDTMIEELKAAIKESELEAEAGVISANTRLSFYKNELEKLETIKNKTKNL